MVLSGIPNRRYMLEVTAMEYMDARISDALRLFTARAPQPISAPKTSLSPPAWVVEPRIDAKAGS
jgi:hypothetical protein